MKVILHDYGGYAFTQQLGRGLAARGHTVRYLYSVTTQFVNRSCASYTQSGFSARGIRLSMQFEKYSLLKRRAAEIEHGQLLAKEIRSSQPDVVISANTPLDAQKIIQQACHETGAHLVFWLQDAIGLATHRILRQKMSVAGDIVGSYYEWLERLLVQHSDRVVLISDDFYPLMDRWNVSREKITVIPNWAPIEELTPQKKVNPWSLKYGLADKFCFLYSGILGLKHNPEAFIHLAQHFQSKPDVRIVIVSEGGGADWLREKQTEFGLANLVLLPFQPSELYPQVLGAADALMSILSPDAGVYSVPSKVLTYLCAQRPLLLAVPSENLAARTVVKAKAGLVAQPLDDADFCVQADRLYQDSDFRKKCGDSARRYAEQTFDIEKILDRFEQVMQSN